MSVALPPPTGESQSLADEARRLLRSGADPARWRSLVDSVYRDAIQRGDLRALSVALGLESNRLDGQGRLAELIAWTDLGLALTQTNPAAKAVILATRATVECSELRSADALQSVAEALTMLEQTPDLQVRGEVLAASAVVRLRTFTAAPSPDAVISELIERGPIAHAALLLSWFIPSLAAHAGWPRVQPWISLLTHVSTLLGHAWRRADADAFEAALSVVQATGTAFPAAAAIRASGNWLATWRLLVLEGYVALEQGRLDAAAHAFARLPQLRRASKAFQDGGEAYEALVRARSGSARVDLQLPLHAGLENLGVILAGAEAVALGGSTASAASWLAWIDRRLPPFVLTSLEWPVMRARVGALLAVRAGEMRRGRSDMAVALEQAQAAGMRREAAVAEVQLNTLWGIGDRLSIWQGARVCGVDPALHAFIVLQCLRQGQIRVLGPEALSAREIEIVALAANGLTNRGIASELGLSIRTVQNHIYRAYEKLGVHTREEARVRLRDTGLI